MAADVCDSLFDLAEIVQSWNGMTFRGIPRASDTFAERVFSKIDASGDCWEWGGTVDDKGYGILGRGRRGSGQIAAHRAVYELLVGEIPAGMHYDHLCRNHSCVNPDHGEIVTPEENKRRGYGMARLHAKRTHCGKGHPLDGMTGGRGSTRKHRYCKTCARERERARRSSIRKTTEGEVAA